MSFYDSDIDTRIMRMEFQNKDFQKNIAKSQKSLEDFKEAMNFDETSRGLQKFERAANNLDFRRLNTNLSEIADSTKEINSTDFTKMSKNIEKLSEYFTGLGKLSTNVLKTIRREYEETLGKIKNFIKSISIDQISKGLEKYDALNKAVMTIVSTGKYTEEQAYTVFERLMTYTNETSYSFATMVDQIAAFTSTGLGLEESEKAMEGIANLAAKAGQNTSTASQAMVVFAKALGAGYLSLDNWQSLTATAKVTTEDFRKTLLETAVEVGDLVEKNGKYYISSKYKAQSSAAKNAAKAAEAEQKSLVEINNLETTLREKWASTETIMKTLQKYYFEGIDDPTADWTTFAGVAAKAAQRATSLKDAIEALKESVSAGWMTSYRLIFGNVTEATEFFTNLANKSIEIFERIGNFRNLVLEKWAAANIYGQSSGGTLLSRILFGDYEAEIKTGAYGLMDAVADATALVKDVISEFFRLFVRKDFQRKWDDEEFRASWFSLQLKTFANNIINFLKRVREFFNAEIKIGSTTTTRLEMIRNIIRGVAGALKIAYDLLKGAVSFFLQVIIQLWPIIDVLANALSMLMNALYDGANELGQGNKIQAFFLGLAEILEPFTTLLVNAAIGISDFFIWLSKNEDFIAVINGLGKGLINVFSLLLIVAKYCIDVLTSLFLLIQDGLINGFSAEKISAWASSVGSGIGGLLKPIYDAILNLLPEPVAEKVKGIVSNLKTFITENASSILNDIISLITLVSEGFQNGFKADRFINWAKDFINNRLNAIQQVFNALLDILPEPVANKIKSVVSALKDFVSKNAGNILQDVSGFIEMISNGFKFGFSADGVLKWVKQFINNRIAPIKGLFESFLSIVPPKISEKITAMIASIKGLIKKIIGVFGVRPDINVVDTLVDWVAEVIRSVKGFFTGVGDLFSGDPDKSFLAKAIEWVTTFIKTIEEKVAGWVPLIADAFVLFAVIKSLKAIGKVIKAIMEVATNLSDAAKNLSKGVFTDFWKNLKGSISEAVNGGKEVEDKGGQLIKIAAAVAIIAGVVLFIGRMPWQNVAIGLGAFLVIVIALRIFLKGVQKTFKDVDYKQALGISAVILALAFAMGQIISAFLPLVNLIDQGSNGLIKISAFVLVFGLMLVAISGAFALLNSGGSDNKTSAGKIAAFAVGLWLIVQAFRPFMELANDPKWLEKLGLMLAGMVVIFAPIIAAIGILREHASKAAELGQLAGLVAAIGVLIVICQMFRGFTAFMDFAKIAVGLASILVPLGLFIWFLSKFGGESIEVKGLLGLAAAVTILTFVAQTFIGLMTDSKGNWYWDNIGKMFIGLMAILTPLAIFLTAVNGLPREQKYGKLILLALSLVAFILVLMPLATYSWDSLGKMLVPFVAIVGMLTLFMKFGSMDLSESFSVMVVMVAIVGLIFIISNTLEEIKDINWEVIAAFTAGLSAIIIALANAIAILSAIPFIAGLKGIALLGIGVVAIGAVLSLLATYFAPMAIDAIGASITSIAAKLGLVSKMIAGFNADMTDTDFKGMDNADSMFTRIKNLLKNYSSLSVFSDKMSTVLTTIRKFVNEMKYFSWANSQIKNVRENQGIELLTVLLEKKDAIESFGKLDINAFSDKLVLMTGALYLYAMALGELDGIAAVNQIEDGADVGNTPNIPRVIQFLHQLSTGLSDNEEGFAIPTDFPEATSVTTFSAALTALAVAMVQFEEAGGKLGSNTDKALEVLDFFANINDKLNDSRYNLATAIEWAKVNGEPIDANSLDPLATGITGIADALTYFAEQTTIIDEKAGEIKPLDFSGAMKTIEAFVELENSMPAFQSTLGLVGSRGKLNAENSKGDSLFLGVGYGKAMTLSDMGAEIEAIGTAIDDFTTKALSFVSDEKEKAREDAIAAISRMIFYVRTLSLQLPVTGGVLEWWNTLWNGRKTTFSEFGGTIEEMGGYLASFGDAIKGKLNESEVTMALDIVDSFLNLLTSFTEIDSVTSATYTATEAAAGIKTFITELLKAVQEPANGKNGAQNTISFLDDIITALVYVNEKLKGISINKDNMGSFLDFIRALITMSSKNLINHQDFGSIGYNIASGIAEGIENGASLVQKAVLKLIEVAFDTATTAAKISSPSRVFMRLGEFVSQGFAIGIENDTGSVVQSINNMSDEAITAAKNIVLEMSRILEEEDESQPIITPILDLTNAKRELNGLSGQLNGGRIQLGEVSAQYASLIGAKTTEKIQNGTDLSGIYTSIAVLGQKIQDVSDSIRNLKLVLNTGAVVGAITDELDLSLGKKNFYAGRKN